MMKMMKTLWSIILQAYNDWTTQKAPRMAAALAYFAVFSIAPLLIIAIAVAGLVFGNTAAEDAALDQVRSLLGDSAADIVAVMVENTSRASSNILATLVGLGVLLWGSTQVFAVMQESLNTIWEVQPKPNEPVKGFLRTRLFSFSMVLVIGFLLLISLVISALLSALGTYATDLLPNLQLLLRVANFLLSFLLVTLLLAAIFKILPDVNLRWRDVMFGAVVTALLFTIGKFLIGLYLGQTSVGSAYGAAGSLVILLLWVNFTALILFFGAELTKAYVRQRHAKITPKSHAVQLTAEEQRKQGIVQPAPDKEPQKGSARGEPSRH